MPIHINLMSQQLIPNVIPTLSVATEKVYLVVAGDSFKENANHLKEFYHSKGIDDVELYHCDDPNDFYSLKYKALDLYKDIQAFYPGQHVLLNATCGTKPMSLAFTMVFDDLENQCMPIYTDTLNKRVVILNDNEKLSPLPFDDVLDIEDYFHLNHFKVHNTQTSSGSIAQEREELTKGILEHSLHYPEAISILNKISQETNFNDKQAFINTIQLTHIPQRDFKAILTLAKEDGLLTDFDKKSVSFANPEAARYLGGGWLEELSYLAAKEAGIEKIAINVEGHLIDQANSSESPLNHH